MDFARWAGRFFREKRRPDFLNPPLWLSPPGWEKGGAEFEDAQARSGRCREARCLFAEANG